jgi:phage terminase large subunit-like protein
VYDEVALQAEIDQLNAAIDAEKYRWACDRKGCDGRPHEGWLHPHARASQRPPDGKWLIWDLMSGRGFGKTRTGAETTRGWGEAKPLTIAVVAKKDTLCREICFEGRSGLLNVIPQHLIPKNGYSKGAGSGSLSLRLTNGTRFIGFSSETPDNLRGWAFDGAWVDEWASFPIKTAQDVIDQLLFCMREAEDPHIIITSTPQAVRHQVKLVERAGKHPGGLIRITRGHTDENRENLSEAALELIYGEFEGTRLGRQELGGELLEDVEGALWKKAWIDENAVTQVYEETKDGDPLPLIGRGEVPEMKRIIVAIDPAISVTETSDETGIVATGRGYDGLDYVIADRSGKVVGIEAAVRAWLLWQELEADEMVYEDNQGDEWVAQVLTDAWNAMQADPKLRWPAGSAPLHSVHAKRSKRLRAEPVAARYEQGRVRHIRRMTKEGQIVNDLGKLEDQQISWVPGESDSPDRLDAAVYGLQRIRDTEGLGAKVSTPMRAADSPAAARKALAAGDQKTVDEVKDQVEKETKETPTLEQRLTQGRALDSKRVAAPGGPVRIRRR